MVLRRARDAWRATAGVPVVFPPAGAARIVVSPGSRWCPPGWAGFVVLGGAAVVTVPTEEAWAAARAVEPPALLDLDGVRAELSPSAMLGPATLAFCDDGTFRPVAGDVVAGQDATALLAACPPEEADESGLTRADTVFVVRRDGRPVAAAGYARWPGRVAHLGVLTAPGHRGRGLARIAASAAVADALAHDLLPQWRARPEASRRVARSLGFRELGRQASLLL